MKSEAEKLYDAIVGDEPAWVEGKNFTALNYGKNYSSIRGGNRRIGIRGNEASYLSFTPESSFPKEVFFRKREPSMSFTEASHAGQYKIVISRLSLEDSITALEREGMRFEK